MAFNYDELGPYANALMLGGVDGYQWLPPRDRDRANAYAKYDQMYWNDINQYPMRYLVGEFPVYVPNPRTVVDTTAHFYLKGLQVSPKNPDGPVAKALSAFLKREMFFSRFHTAKHTGVARGDYCLHMTADPSKPAGKRISLNPVHPGKVVLDMDPDDNTRVTQAHLVERIPHPTLDGEWVVKELRYWYSTQSDELVSVFPDEQVRGYEDGEEGDRKVMREENLWSTNYDWWDEENRELVQNTLAQEELPEPIDCIPVYWFTNLAWDDGPYGYSDLRGFEHISQSISQVTTDQSTSLSLEGLGVYTTDGGSPVNADGTDADWEISPGKVMEVPAGAYFRRVEGVGSVKPNMDHINYLESKIREAGGLSDVALGRVDVQTAQSGIAMAIKFMPTLAKLEERDKTGTERLTQLFYDWKSWWAAYEHETFSDEIVVTIGDKLPTDRTGRINELNNMLDRQVISRAYYRAEMQKLGYDFPKDIEDEIYEELEKDAEAKADTAPPGIVYDAPGGPGGTVITPPAANPNQPGQVTQKNPPNQSNNKKRPNESSGTEAHQKVASQARGGKPVAVAGKK